jgi:hypothetical protein
MIGGSIPIVPTSSASHVSEATRKLASQEIVAILFEKKVKEENKKAIPQERPGLQTEKVSESKKN